ncbi:MAG: hypothetical protein JWP11_3850 [Frankiales bacterium]|nr:hypothetical protein [Frankiales bacterium]
MLYADGALGLVLLCVWVYALLDVLTSDETRIRNLPKWGWFVIVLILGEVAIGPLLWFIAGRPQGSATRPGGLPYKGNTGRFPEYERPGRAVAQNPDDDEAFLRGLRDRADEQRRRAAENAKREDDPTP